MIFIIPYPFKKSHGKNREKQRRMRHVRELPGNQSTG
nr:MAG TPA: hypothetical protein [Inoviridae sp.]